MSTPFSNPLVSVDLEKVVRPFLPVSNPPTRIRSDEVGVDAPTHTTSTTEPGLVALTWNARADVQTVDLPMLSVNLPDDSNDTDGINGEINRATEIIRVTNPDDPSQYVDVERVKSITFSNQSQQKRVYNFDNSGNDE